MPPHNASAAVDVTSVSQSVSK